MIHDPVEGDKSKFTQVRAKGCFVWDDKGREYLNCTSQAWSNRLDANDDHVVETALCLILLEDTITKSVDGTVAVLNIEPNLGNGGHIRVGKA